MNSKYTSLCDRRYARYLAQDHAFAALSNEYDRVGKVVNISLGGLSFEYLCNEKQLASGLSQLNIFLTRNGFHLPDLMCRIIYDNPRKSDIQNIFCTIPKNICAVKFVSLSDFQLDRLDYFINNYTIGPAS